MTPLYAMLAGAFLIMTVLTLPTLLHDARLGRERRRAEERRLRQPEPEAKLRRHGFRGVPRVRHAGRNA